MEINAPIEHVVVDSVEVPRHRRDDELYCDCPHTGKARDRELRPARHVAVEADLGPAEVLPVFRHRYQLPQWGVELHDVRK